MTAGRPRMRIVMTADAVGGVWSYVAGLARELGQRGHRVHVVVLGPEPAAAQRDSLRDIPGVSLEVSGLALEWADPAGEDVPRARAYLAEVARRVRPDIVHLNGYREAAYGWGAPVLVAAHSCVWSWWRACRGGDPDEARWSTYLENVRAGLAAADGWVAPTAAFHASIDDLYRPLTPGTVIHNGTTSAADSRAGKELLILGAGRLWDEAKNLAALAAVALHTTWPVVIAGPTASDPNGSACENRATGNVTFTGALPHRELRARMERAAIFVSPALYEPFGLAALEAAVAGCALVLSDLPSFRELWDGAALFVDPRDSESLRAALERLQADADLRGELGAAAAARARCYTLERMADSYAALYASMAGGQVRAARAPALEAAR